MPSFSKKSKERLDTCDYSLKTVLNEVIKVFDFTVLEGYRDKDKQNSLFKSGKSKVKYPDSKHNTKPSRAVDIAPYPIDFEDRERYFLLAGFILATAVSKGIDVRWGGAWRGIKNLKNNTFDDLGHFELKD